MNGAGSPGRKQLQGEKKMTEYGKRIREELVDFFSNLTTSFSEEAASIAAVAQREWDNLPCDPEGATPEQDEEMENFLADTVSEILDIDRIWNKDFCFTYCRKNNPVILKDGWAHEGYNTEGRFTEYDGTEINAPDEETAWELFLSMDGEFGIPDSSDYSCEEIK